MDQEKLWLYDGKFMVVNSEMRLECFGFSIDDHDLRNLQVYTHIQIFLVILGRESRYFEVILKH